MTPRALLDRNPRARADRATLRSQRWLAEWTHAVGLQSVLFAVFTVLTGVGLLILPWFLSP